MSSQATVLSVWLHPLVDYLETLGVDSREVFAYAGVGIDHVFVPGVRLPVPTKNLVHVDFLDFFDTVPLAISA